MEKYRAPQRIAAPTALVLPPVILVLAVDIVVEQFPRGLIVLAGVAIAFAAAWYGLLRTGAARVLGVAIAVVALAATVVVLITDGDHVVQALVILAGIALALAATRAAFSVHVPLADARPPEHPVLFFNPKSGGGKAERFNLAEEARARGIRPIELTLGSDLEATRAWRRGRWRRRAGDGRGRRVTGDRRRDRRRARSALRLHPGGHPQPLRPRPGRRSR